MIEKTIDGISNALHDTFGYDVYVDSIQQDLNPPGFLIVPLDQKRIRGLGDRYQQVQSFDIRYFPQNGTGTLECAIVLERLYDALEYIRIDGDIVWGTSLHGEIREGVLHFFVNFDLFLTRSYERINMEEAAVSVMEKMA